MIPGIIALVVLITTPILGLLIFVRIYRGGAWHETGLIARCGRFVCALIVALGCASSWMNLWRQLLDWTVSS